MDTQNKICSEFKTKKDAYYHLKQKGTSAKNKKNDKAYTFNPLTTKLLTKMTLTL